MPYKHGRPVIDISFPFRMASVLLYHCIIMPIAMLINFMQHSTRFKYRCRIIDLRRAITVSNHTTIFDPVKIASIIMPHLNYQTMLEGTGEFPFLGTFIRLLGGVPLPRGVTGYKKILEIAGKSFKYRRYIHFYPEGECYLYNQKIKEFKTGAFRIAAELDVPVVPLVTVFKEGFFKPWSFWGRSLPVETLYVMEPEYPANYIKRDDKGEITPASIKEFTEAVRVKMQALIDEKGGTHVFYRGHMERIKGLND